MYFQALSLTFFEVTQKCNLLKEKRPILELRETFSL